MIMDIYEEKYQYNLSRNLRKKASYQNIFEIQSIIHNFNNKFNLNLSKDNNRLESYTNKNINIYNINNKNLNKIILNANRHFNIGPTSKIYSFKRRKISSSYFDKIRNLYNLKTPTLLSERIITKKRKFINQKINQNNINNKNINNKKTKNENYILPKLSNNRKNVLSNIMNKKLNLIFLENSKSYSLSNKNGNEYNMLNNKIKLPRVKSTIEYDNKSINYNRILNRNKRLMRCNSSTNKSNIGVKSIYMSFGLTLPKKPKFNFSNKIILLKNKYKGNIKSEENQIYKRNKITACKLIYDDEINKLKKININKEIGKEYKFNQNFKKVNINNINNENDNILLNDKGTIIGSFFN